MAVKPVSVVEYISNLSEDRRIAMTAVRKTILENLDSEFEEGMQGNMIGYYVPHRIFPAGYHCNPKQPMPFAALTSQKASMSLHLLPLYISGGCDSTAKPGSYSDWFQKAWKASGKKLDAGKACVRFKSLNDVPLEVIGQAIQKFTAKKWIETFQSALAESKSDRSVKKRS